MYQDYIAKQEYNFLWDKINEIGSYVEIRTQVYPRWRFF